MLAGSHSAVGRPLRGRLLRGGHGSASSAVPTLVFENAAHILVAVLRIIRVRSTLSRPSFVEACTRDKEKDNDYGQGNCRGQHH